MVWEPSLPGPDNSSSTNTTWHTGNTDPILVQSTEGRIITENAQFKKDIHMT